MQIYGRNISRQISCSRQRSLQCSPRDSINPHPRYLPAAEFRQIPSKLLRRRFPTIPVPLRQRMPYRKMRSVDSARLEIYLAVDALVEYSPQRTVCGTVRIIRMKQIDIAFEKVDIVEIIHFTVPNRFLHHRFNVITYIKIALLFLPHKHLLHFLHFRA